MITSADVTVESLIIDGFDGDGLLVTGNDALIVGNFIGTDATGSAPLGNSSNGIEIDSGATGDTIGGAVDGGGNVISGNGQFGIEINDSSSNLIINNTIGLSADLSAALGNGVNGINIENDSTSNTIGGTGLDDGNRVVCTDPGFAAIAIGNDGDGSDDNLIQGNTINLSADGKSSLGVGNGIYIGSDHNTIGGTAAGARNVVVGAGGYTAIWLNSSGSFDNLIEGNYVGTTADGSASAGGGTGFSIDFAYDNTIGGYAPDAGNVISGNAGDGIDFQNADGNVVAGNRIGTNATGFYSVPNGSDGILLEQGSSNNTIGGSVAGSGNLISGNASWGLAVTGPTTQNDVVTADKFGRSTSGSASPQREWRHSRVQRRCALHRIQLDHFRRNHRHRGIPECFRVGQ